MPGKKITLTLTPTMWEGIRSLAIDGIEGRESDLKYFCGPHSEPEREDLARAASQLSRCLAMFETVLNKARGF